MALDTHYVLNLMKIFEAFSEIEASLHIDV